MKTYYKSLCFLLFICLLGACKKDQSTAGCITIDTTNPLVNQTITFTDCITGALSATWSFGDGSTGSGVITSHLYYSVGTYIVTLTSTSSTGQVTTTTKTLVVNALPSAAFNFSFCNYASMSDFVQVGDTVRFTSSGSHATSFFWNFGDGTTSTDSMPVHVFTQVNSQQAVKLRVSNALGSDSSTVTFAVQTVYTGTFDFISGGYGNVVINNSTGLTAGSTFGLPGYPSYDPYASCSNTVGTVVSGRTFVINTQNITFVNGAGGSNIYATIHGHGYLTGTCSTGKLYIIDTMVTTTGTTVIFNDSLNRQQY